jgi:hypothetical protein
MSKHTPGPWEVRPLNNEIINADHGRLPFGIVAGYTLIGALYENDADARLIAAAPDLLEFAQEVRRSGDTRLASMALALIAKAEGA